MKKIFIAIFGLFFFALNANAQKKSGAIQFETTTDPAAMAAANGIQLSEEMKARMPKAVKTNFELLFTATNASYMPVEETEDSNGGTQGRGMGRMMMSFGGAGGNREYYYTFADKKLVEVFDLNDTTYVMEGKLQAGNPDANVNFSMRSNQNGQQNTSAVQFLPVPPTYEVVKSDETKNIVGLNCNKVIIKTTRKAKILDMEKDIVDEAVLWYTKDLGFDFSPNTNLWTEGAVLAIENKGNTISAKSIEYRNVSAKDVTAPKKALAITPEEYRAKKEAMMKRMRTNFRGQGANGQAKSIVIN